MNFLTYKISSQTFSHFNSFDDDDNESPPRETREVILAGKIKLPTPPPQETPIEIEKPVFKHGNAKCDYTVNCCVINIFLYFSSHSSTQLLNKDDRIPEKQKQCWHPVMWHTPPLPNQIEDYGGGKPHGRIVRNVRSVF